MANIKSSTIAGGVGSQTRRDFDFYETPESATLSLLSFLKNNIEVDFKMLHVWEPACGNGAISKVLKQKDIIVHSTDIRETEYNSASVDYLSANIQENEHNCIITNPPFNLAANFIEKSFETPLVAFLLKSHFWQAKCRISLFNKRKPSYILPLTWRLNFTNQKSSPTMDMMWCVWTPAGPINTEYIPIFKP